MTGLFLLALMGLGAVAVAATIGALVFLVRAIFWLVLLPFRILLWLLWIPVGLVMGALGLAAGIVALPVLLVVAASLAFMSLVGALLSVMLPLVPFVLLGLLVWAVFRHRPAAAV